MRRTLFDACGGMRRVKGQTALEYVILVAGVLLFIVLLLVIVRGGLFPSAGGEIANGSGTIHNLTGNLTNQTLGP
ncbi:Uncharacterised protein [Candidatus Norongarragalina meridionalis]|nr:Uncharacterised protein [Candidatus Norongarragalina meridionalis]